MSVLFYGLSARNISCWSEPHKSVFGYLEATSYFEW